MLMPDPNIPLKRSRYVWTQERDELLLDSEAIIGARRRGTTYRGRPAIVQVLPDIKEQSVRTRLKAVLDMPGKTAYLERLTDVWYEIWTEHRGTPLLPDPDPNSPKDFDLRAHIEFLRQRVDKRAM
jgi:hypothetical protein